MRQVFRKAHAALQPCEIVGDLAGQPCQLIMSPLQTPADLIIWTCAARLSLNDFFPCASHHDSEKLPTRLSEQSGRHGSSVEISLYHFLLSTRSSTMTYFTRLLLFAVAALHHATNSVAAAPTTDEPRNVQIDDESIVTPHFSVEYRPTHTTRHDGSPSELRILSLGASIMSGVGSTDGSGYATQTPKNDIE